MTHLQPLLLLTVSLAAALGWGRLLLGALRYAGRGGLLGFVDEVALGLGTIAYCVLAAGLAGVLRPWVLAALLAAGLALLAGTWRRSGTLPSPPQDTVPRSGRSGATLVQWLLYGYLAVLGVLTAAGALGPVDGLDWDSLSYHLAAPKIYLREGRIGFIAYDSHTHFPFTMEMLYTLGLQFGGAPGAKLFHWAAGWLTAGAVGAWTARFQVGGRPAPAWAPPLAAATFISMPIVLWELGTAYVDLGTALFQLLALSLLLDRLASGEGQDPRRAEAPPRWTAFALAGIFSGFAMGTKMTALVQFGLIGAGLLWAVVGAAPAKRSERLAAAALFGGAGAVVAAPWYLKSWLWTGNPVYPFFYHLFPGSYSWTPEAAAAYATEQRSFGLGRRVPELLLAPWNLAVHGRAFFVNERALVGDKLGSLGPHWAGLVPVLLWCRGLDRRAVPVLWYCAGSLLAWFVLSQQARYFCSVLAPLAAILALVPAALPSSLLRAGAAVFCAGGLALSLVMHLPLATTRLSVVTGVVQEREYLESQLPGLYEAARYVNSLPQDVRVALYQETRGYYLDRNYFWANPLQHNLIPYDRLATGADLVRELGRFGITHVLINYDFCRGVEQSRWYLLLMDAMRSGHLRENFRSRTAEPGRRGVIVYRVATG